LDCGSGTGTTGIMAARKAGPNGRVTLFDLSDAMQSVARQKVIRAGLQKRIVFEAGDMVHLPFESNRFDVVLSTYSMCPLYDPTEGALELYRVAKPGGMIGVAHSTEPRGPFARWIAGRVENWAWQLHWLSMGCRPVEVLPALKHSGGRVLLHRFLSDAGTDLPGFINSLGVGGRSADGQERAF
jgi:ubiquinone/menaquinone biosynthesis C-methylase UbiE